VTPRLSHLSEGHHPATPGHTPCVEPQVSPPFLGISVSSLNSSYSLFSSPPPLFFYQQILSKKFRFPPRNIKLRGPPQGPQLFPSALFSRFSPTPNFLIGLRIDEFQQPRGYTPFQFFSILSHPPFDSTAIELHRTPSSWEAQMLLLTFAYASRIKT